MSEKPVKPKDVVSLDTETNLQTTEGRVFLNQLRQVSRVLLLRDATVDFKGEEILKTGYVGEFKSIQLFKCPNGYFIFGDRAFGKNNWSATGETLDEIMRQVADGDVRKSIQEAVAPVPEAA